MAHRVVTDSPLGVHGDLLGKALASPLRRLLAFLVDAALLLLPSAVVAIAVAALSLWFTDPAAFQAIQDLFSRQPQGDVVRTLGELAPVLVRIQAPGLPPSVALAVEESDLTRAGEILSEYSIDISLTPGEDGSPLMPGHIRLESERLIPRGFRSAAALAVAALYFTFLTWGRRSATIGKWLAGIRVRRLDGRPLTLWESFERFGGYLASVGTFGFGLLDFWRDPNRRLAHDRISNTVVLRTRWRRKCQDA
jgi:uncharacterized RDD family membrane protein YckC